MTRDDSWPSCEKSPWVLKCFCVQTNGCLPVASRAFRVGPRFTNLLEWLTVPSRICEACSPRESQGCKRRKIHCYPSARNVGSSVESELDRRGLPNGRRVAAKR